MTEPLRLPRLLTEDKVAELLGISTDTVRRERKRKRLGFTRIGGRVRYAEDQVAAYLQNQREEASPCRKISSALVPSGNIGSADEGTLPPGAAHGSTPTLDRRAVHLSAQTILSKRSSPSRRG